MPIHCDEPHHPFATAWTEPRRPARKKDRRRQGQRRTFVAAIASLVRLLAARDAATLGHSLRVRTLALGLAERLGLDARTRARLGLAARLHDIGKIGLAEGILAKPGPLTAAESALMRQHPALGERILRPLVQSRAVLGAIRHHHERFDGQGYPDRLAGERIPLLARIIAIADGFDAMTTSRSYRNALPHEEAIARLVEASGKQFDPALVPSFIALIRGAA